MLSDLSVRLNIGDLIYVTGLMPQGHGRFSRCCLLSVCSSLAYLIVLMIQGARREWIIRSHRHRCRAPHGEITALEKEYAMPQVQIDKPSPQFTLKNFDGKPVSLSDYHSHKNVVLVFNRGFT
jgi:hypothetical protein